MEYEPEVAFDELKAEVEFLRRRLQEMNADNQDLREQIMRLRLDRAPHEGVCGAVPDICELVWVQRWREKDQST